MSSSTGAHQESCLPSFYLHGVLEREPLQNDVRQSVRVRWQLMLKGLGYGHNVAFTVGAKLIWHVAVHCCR